MKKERIVNEDISIYKEHGCINIQLCDHTIILTPQEWTLFMKPLFFDIFCDVIKHHKRHGYLHSNEIDNIIFNQ